MRNWLINHGVIKGWKAAALSEKDQRIIEALDHDLKDFNLSANRIFEIINGKIIKHQNAYLFIVIIK